MLVSNLFGCLAFILLMRYTASLNENSTSMEWANTAQQTFSNTADALSFGRSVIGSFDGDKYGKFYGTLSKKAGRLAGVFGGIGSMFAFILAFIPGDESAELKLMKSEFAKLTQKVDMIAESLEDTKTLIKAEVQLAAYLQYEHRIKTGASELKKCLAKLEAASCANLTECRRKKQAIAEDYITSMDIRADMEAIFRGATSDSAFGSSLLELLKEQSKCNMPKIDLLSNKITAMIMQAMTVVIFHDLLTETDYNVLDDTVRANEMLRILENKRQSIQDSCFVNIDYWIRRDVKTANTEFTQDTQQTNTGLLNKLKAKYPWINWHVFTFAGEKEPVAGPTNSPRTRMHSTSKSEKIHTFVIPTNKAKVENWELKKQKWKALAQTIDISGDLNQERANIENKIKDDPDLDGEVQSFAILPGTRWIWGYKCKEIRQTILGTTTREASSMNVYVSRPDMNKYFLAVVSFRQIDDPYKCSKTCNGSGKCFVYPYSRQDGCKCKPGFSGQGCEVPDTNLHLQSVVTSLLENTMKLPSFTSIQHTLEDVHLSLKASSENIQESIVKLGDKIDEKFRSLGEFVLNTMEYFAVMLKYKDSIDNLNYFHSISSTNIYKFPNHKNFTFASITTKASDDRFSMLEEKDISRFLLTPTGIQKWLHQLNYLIVGRMESQINYHKPLLFMVMDQYKDRLCSPEYKDKLTRVYHQLLLLQLEGYMLFGKAYSSVHMESSAISNRYRKMLQYQQGYLQNVTCEVKIPHSKNLENCEGGFYIYNSLNVNVTCDDGYFTKGMSV